MDTGLTLPKPYLSWSQVRVWLEDKEAYRRRYYYKEEEPGSRYMMFGSEIAKGLEAGTIQIPNLPQYPVREQQIKVDVDGVPFYGYIDQFDPERLKFREIKTGIMRPNGKPRWTQADVQKHGQLDVYSLLVQLKYGAVDDECHLDWIVTRGKTKCITDFDGNELCAVSNELELSGDVFSFARVITQNERDRARMVIRSVANEISGDYRAYLALSSSRLPDLSSDSSSDLSGR